MLEYIGVILFVIVSAVFYQYADLKGRFFTVDFETTDGLITKSETVYKHGVKRGEYHYDILYQYSIEGNQQESGQVTFGPTGLGKHKAQEMVDKYPIGSRVKVYYESENPTFSVLEPGENENISYLILLFLMFLPLLMFGYHVILKRNSPKKSAIRAREKRK